MSLEKEPPRKRKRAVLEVVNEDDGNSKFARALGSVDYQTREKGLQALATWLSKKQDLQEQDLKRLWKGIFYCFWHADRAPFQADLAGRLADILLALKDNAAYLYYTVFLSTMKREWFGIDRLRLDKFMMLVRTFMKALFQYLQAHKWDIKLTTQFMDYIQDAVLLGTDSHPAAGLAYHIADVFVAELASVSRAGRPPAAALKALLQPFCQTLARTSRAAFLPRLREAVFDAVAAEVLHPSDNTPFKHLDAQALADHIFQLGALPETHAKNRQELYGVSSDLQKTVKKQQAAPVKKGKKALAGTSQFSQKPGSSAVTVAASQDSTSSQADALSGDQRKAVKSTAKEMIESPDSFAKEATAALHEAADQMPQAAAAQLNGKQLKALKKKQKAQKAALPAQALLSEQKHQAQLAGAAEAVPLKLKQKKLAQQKPDANGLLGIDSDFQQQEQQQEQSARPTKKQKKSKQDSSKYVPAANGNADVHSTTDALANRHGGDVPSSPASQKKKVRFSMKRNLLMQIGGAVPPENIRTPPDSRPKGSALKQSSLLDHQQHQMKLSGSKRKGSKSKSPRATKTKLSF